MINNLENLLKQQTSHMFPAMSLKDIPQPEELKNCMLMAEQILKRLYEGKRLLIVGDYDADGIMASTILYSFLIDLGFTDYQINYLIPSRLKDGYGFSPNIVGYAKEGMYDFIVTVDNGVSAVEAIELAQKEGLEIFVTDHHTAPEVLPNCLIVNPRVPGETFPYTYISGATVAWYLCAAMKKVLISWGNSFNINLANYLDYVAITIISDVMPLENINLPLFYYGLGLIKERRRFIYHLMWNDWSAPTIDEIALGFNLNPFINAIGRIDDANIGVELFLSKDSNRTKELFNYVKSVNEERKELSRASVKEAIEYIEDFENPEDKVIIVRNKDFHEGIVGIIAGKLAEKYQKPAFVLTYNEKKNIWKGSGRTSGEIHLYDLLNTASTLLAGFGGHKGAVGLGVKDENFHDFFNKMKEETSKINSEDFLTKSNYPLELNEISENNMDLFSMIRKYAPYGHGNEKPFFILKDVSVKQDKELKDGLHYVCIIEKNGIFQKSLFFNVEDDFIEKINSGRVSIKIDPNVSYDLKNEVFRVEPICSLI